MGLRVRKYQESLGNLKVIVSSITWMKIEPVGSYKETARGLPNGIS